MRALRKLVLGETWTLPLGVLATLALALTLHEAAGDTAWWRHAGGFVLAGVRARRARRLAGAGASAAAPRRSAAGHSVLMRSSGASVAPDRTRSTARCSPPRTRRSARHARAGAACRIAGAADAQRAREHSGGGVDGADPDDHPVALGHAPNRSRSPGAAAGAGARAGTPRRGPSGPSSAPPTLGQVRLLPGPVRAGGGGSRRALLLARREPPRDHA